MDRRSYLGWIGKTAIPAALLLVTAAAFGQGTGQYSTFDVNVFGGVQNFTWMRSHPVHEFANGPVFGLRFTPNISNHIGLETDLQYGINNLVLNPVQPYPVQRVGAGVRNYQLSVGPVFFFTPRQAGFRPYIRVGVGATWYDPTDEAAQMFRQPSSARYMVQRFNMRYGPAGFFGAGVMINASRRVGLRFDFGGMISQTPHFGMVDYPRGPGTLYIPRHGTEFSLKGTAALVFRFRHREDIIARAAPPPEPPPPPPPPPPPEINVGALAGLRTVCAGDVINPSVEASGWPAERQPVYNWTLNGQAVEGNAATVAIPTKGLSGEQKVGVRVSAGDASKETSGTFNVSPMSPPSVSMGNLPTEVPYGEKVPLSATCPEQQCGGPGTITFAVAEGSVSGNVFDTGTVPFDMANRSRRQARTVRVTATCRNQGGSANAQRDVTVYLNPVARRLDDLVFPANSSRVNNCGKRLLLEELTPLLSADVNGKVVLIGHRDERERGTGLDRARVLNAAAVLSAGTGICPQLELSRVSGAWVGTTQTPSEPRPAMCGASTNIRERSGQTVREGDSRAPFRRVEVWFVPQGAELPAALSQAVPLSQSDVKPLGCPR